MKEKAPPVPRTADAATTTSASPAPAAEEEGGHDLDNQEIDDDALSVSTVASSGKGSPGVAGSAAKGKRGKRMTAAEEEAAFHAFVAAGKVGPSVRPSRQSWLRVCVIGLV